MSRDDIPPGSWGGDFGNDPLGNEYRIKQIKRMEQIHAQEEVRRKAAEANAEKLIIKKRQEQFENEIIPEMFDKLLPKKQNEDEIYANINQAESGDGSDDAWVQKSLPKKRTLSHQDVQHENLVENKRPLRKMSFVKQSPDFSAGQAISWMDTLRNLVENNQINYQIIIEAMKVTSELQYALAEALNNFFIES